MNLTDEQINELIHEKLFGKHWHQMGKSWVGDDSTACPKCEKKWRCRSQGNYTGTWDGAHKIIRQMSRRGFIVKMEGDFKDYMVTFHNGKESFVGVAYEFPKAACLAALKAIGEIQSNTTA